MSIISKVAHLTIPSFSNNHKAKLLHNSSLAILLCLVIVFQLFVIHIPFAGSKVLGYAANISIPEVVKLTNQERQKAGVGQVTVNPQLTEAARKKGEDMLAKDYWAHVAPDGTQPWKFFIDAGYKYKYAGENLARDFSSAQAAVDAWMASPSHKENLLSSKYDEIGVAVVEGDLSGVDTTIIVQLFGSRQSLAVAIPEASASEVNSVPLPTPTTIAPSPTPTDVPVMIASTENNGDIQSSQPASNQMSLSPFASTKIVSLIVTGFLMLLLAIDGILVKNRKIPRKSGRTFAHLAFLGMIFILILVVKAGAIL